MAHLLQQIISERIDDVVLLLEVMKKMGLPEILNQYLPRHWKQEGLDWGWVACIWLSHIISQGADFSREVFKPRKNVTFSTA
ncbi:hypothetical protein LC612_39270 [Nostoc sp. CHAB 5834]|nr:hypothetical protein [Nostoc sp. CHAB 5834]